jgi:hypothetical protein
MLKRTITLLGLTITVGVLLLTLGCGGSNSNPVAPVSSDQPSRGWRDSNVELLSHSSPAVVKVTDPDGILSITVRDSAGGRAYYFPGGAPEFQFQLNNFGQVNWYVIGIVDGRNCADSTWIILKNGTDYTVYRR